MILSFKSGRFKHLQLYYAQYVPNMNAHPGSMFLTASEYDMREALPSCDVRRKILEGDALASVDGFGIMVLLTFKHVFGLRCCPNCPHCNVGGSPCQDVFGSSATAEGGCFGRIDAVFTSIEAQKSTGSLHAHSHVLFSAYINIQVCMT